MGSNHGAARPAGLTLFTPRAPDQLARARVAAAGVPDGLPGCRAFLGGSLFAGLGTPQSDVDLFLVPDAGADEPDRQVLVGGSRVDVECWPLAELRKAVDTCTVFSVTEADASQAQYASRPLLDRLARFAHAELVRDDGVLAGLQARVRAAGGELARLVAARTGVEVRLNTEDAHGFLEVGDWPAAHHISRLALLSAAEAALSARGDVYLGPKWIWARWRRTIGDALGADVTDVVFDRVATDPAADVRRRLWLAQDLLLGTVTPAYDLRVDPDPALPRRDSYATPFPTADAVLVYRTGRKAVRLSPAGALLWGLAHGRDRRTAVDAVLDHLRATTPAVSADQVGSYHASLVRAGLLHTEPGT